MTRKLIAVVALSIGITAMPAFGQNEFPDRPIRVIMPFAPGGGGDLVVRSVADKMAQKIGQPIVVENRPGASGFIGAQVVAKSAPDGYTLLMGFDGSLAIATQILKPTFDPLNDLVPVTKLADSPLMLLANPSVKQSSVKELVAYSRSLPGGLSYGTAGNGTTHHMVGELLALKTGMKLTHVPYKGGGQAVADAVAGQVPLLVTVLPTAIAFIREGKLKPIAITSKNRSPSIPEVPTMAEEGVPDFDVMSWYGIFAPAKTPKPIVDKLQAAFAAALADADVRAIYQKAGFIPVGNRPEVFDKQFRADYSRWGTVIKEAHIKAE